MDELGRLLAHARWADGRLLDALIALPDVPAPVLKEMAHVVGAEETWLSRLAGRAARVPVWPELSLAEAALLARSVHEGYGAFLSGLEPDGLDRVVTYTRGQGTFGTSVRDILLQVTLHGQYHRGKINRILRDEGLEPAPVDYIYFVRGVPATH